MTIVTTCKGCGQFRDLCPDTCPSKTESETVSNGPLYVSSEVIVATAVEVYEWQAYARTAHDVAVIEDAIELGVL